MTSLNLALIGNGAVSALVSPRADIVWGCFPRYDSDPMFCSLLQPVSTGESTGIFAIELLDHVREEQEYVANTAVLTTRIFDSRGGCVEITDFAPRFRQFGRIFTPIMFVRRLTRLTGDPRIRVRLHPARDYGRHRAEITAGSNHIRFVGNDVVLRLTTDHSISAILEETPRFLEGSITMLLGPDETVQEGVAEIGRRFQEETTAYWREWVRYLGIPYEWQDAVIRAAISLQLNVNEDTGAIVAAMTTSIPEAADSGRNWDYRYCWLRDAYFVVNALNKLGATRTMERYLSYILNIAASVTDGRLQPVYGISGQAMLEERTIPSLSGYRGMGPVRIGNEAYLQVQHDVYGSVIVAAAHVFLDRRLMQRGDEELFGRLEILGERAAELFDQPDAGIWELRGTPRVHTFSSVMCWVGCDRLSRIAALLGLSKRARYWHDHATRMHAVISSRSWNASLGCFVASMDGASLDASLLRLHEVGFLAADDPRFAGTVHAIERDLMHDGFVFRYIENDDFGKPENAFLACTFWYISALAALGRRDEARSLFERVLACRNAHGLLAEHIDPRTREQWGNFVQTYSMAGIIDAAVRLSRPWDEAI